MLMLMTSIAYFLSVPMTPTIDVSKCNAPWASPKGFVEVIKMELRETPQLPSKQLKIVVNKCDNKTAHIRVIKTDAAVSCVLTYPLTFEADNNDKQRTIALQASEMVRRCQKISSEVPAAPTAWRAQQPLPAPPTPQSVASPSGADSLVDDQQRPHFFSKPETATFALETRRGGWFCKCDLMETAENTQVKRSLSKFSPEDLFQLADTARRDGSPEAALIPLKTMLSHYPNHPRAPIAAFTMAKIYKNALQIPMRAAQYYQKALIMGLPEPLRETAPANIAHAYGVAQHPNSKIAAGQYLNAYPNGTYRYQIRRLLH